MLSDFLRAGFSFESGGVPSRFAGIRSPSDLLDAVQETFLRAFRSDARQVYDGVRPFKGYLFRIGRNVVLDELRRGRYAAQLLAEPEAESVEPHAEELLLDREAAALVREFAASLEARARKVFSARFEKGLAQREAAKAAGMTRIQLRRIEERLKLDLLEFLRARGYLTAYRERTFALAIAKRGDEE
jgi:RNA polymerase sigma factor (sigma-70 family)